MPSDSNYSISQRRIRPELCGSVTLRDYIYASVSKSLTQSRRAAESQRRTLKILGSFYSTQTRFAGQLDGNVTNEIRELINFVHLNMGQARRKRMIKAVRSPRGTEHFEDSLPKQQSLKLVFFTRRNGIRDAVEFHLKVDELGTCGLLGETAGYKLCQTGYLTVECRGSSSQNATSNNLLVDKSGRHHDPTPIFQ